MNKKAFTIVELMVVLVISTLIAAVTYRIYYKQQRDFLVYSNQQHLQLETKNALNAVVADLQSCRGTISYDSSTDSYTWPRFVKGGSDYSADSILPVEFQFASNEVFRTLGKKKSRVAVDIS
jgi:prepilin-type N-terminal cleavage/methylation domain-containing protein